MDLSYWMWRFALFYRFPVELEAWPMRRTNPSLLSNFILTSRTLQLPKKPEPTTDYHFILLIYLCYNQKFIYAVVIAILFMFKYDFLLQWRTYFPWKGSYCSRFTVPVWSFAAIQKSCWTMGEGREKTHEQENTESVF